MPLMTMVLHVRHADHPHAVLAPGLLQLPHLGPLQPRRVKSVHSGGGGNLVIPAARAPCPQYQGQSPYTHWISGSLSPVVDGHSFQSDQSLGQCSTLGPGVPALIIQYLRGVQWAMRDPPPPPTTSYTWSQHIVRL